MEKNIQKIKKNRIKLMMAFEDLNFEIMVLERRKRQIMDQINVLDELS